jgi:hypothetical protein
VGTFAHEIRDICLRSSIGPGLMILMLIVGYVVFDPFRATNLR